MKKTLLFIQILILASLAYGKDLEIQTYHSKEGAFSFQIPEGWSQIPDQALAAFNSTKPEKYHFQGGLESKLTSPPTVHMLLQVKKRPKESESKIETYKKAALPAKSLSVIEKVIKKKQYKRKSEFYSEKYDSFLMITENTKGLSIMSKTFTDYGYNIMHFYLKDDISTEIKKIELILETFGWDQTSANDKAEALPVILRSIDIASL